MEILLIILAILVFLTIEYYFHKKLISKVIETIKSYIPKYDLESYKDRKDYSGIILHGREIQKCNEVQYYQNLIKDIEKL